MAASYVLARLHDELVRLGYEGLASDIDDAARTGDLHGLARNLRRAVVAFRYEGYADAHGQARKALAAAQRLASRSVPADRRVYA